MIHARRRVTVVRLILAGAMVTLGGCAYDGATGYAPQGYPEEYASGMGSAMAIPPGDRFGGQNVVSVDVFTGELSRYGDWVNSRYGRAFRPDVRQDWRPYVNGRWGEDRLWISDDPWGWATDHYGRWGFDTQIGWVWVPGTEWAPSWVAWREDPRQNVTGWAPVPPGVNYSLSFGFGSGFGYDDYANWYAPSWVWVPQGAVYQRGFGGRVLPWRYGANYWGGSRWQYQPGFGGRAQQNYYPQQGGNFQYRPDYYQGQPGYAQPRSQQDGNWQGRPQQGGYYQGRPQQGGIYQSRPQPRGDISTAIGEGIVVNGAVGTSNVPADRPVMTYADRPRPAQAPPQMRPQPAPRAEMPTKARVQVQTQVQTPVQTPVQDQPRVQREEIQRQTQSQSLRRNDEGNTRPD